MKKFRDLLLAGIDEDIHGTTIERLIKVKQAFESEMIYNGMKPTAELLTDWLQGLCWAVHVPFINDDIVKWYEHVLDRKVKNDTEYTKWLDGYWPQCGRTLYEMLYK